MPGPDFPAAMPGLAEKGLLARLVDDRDRRRTLLALTAEADAILSGMARTHLEELRRIQPALIGLVERFGQDGAKDDAAVRIDRCRPSALGSSGNRTVSTARCCPTAPGAWLTTSTA
jgi:hypothetical protein